MAAVNSTMVELSSNAPEFNLTDTRDGQLVSLAQAQDKPVLIMFICNHCPYVIHIIEPLVEIANQAKKDGFFVVAISANDVENYPQDSPENMSKFAKQYGFEFPYLFDEDQSVAKAYKAACTPDFYVYNQHHKLRYRGQMDSARPNNQKSVSGDDLRNALSAVKAGIALEEPQLPSIGCNIKWKSGNQPDYF